MNLSIWSGWAGHNDDAKRRHIATMLMSSRICRMRLIALWIAVLFLCSSIATAGDRSHAKQSKADAKKPVMALHLDVIDPRKDDVPKDFTQAFTKKLWLGWLNVMPQSAMLRDSGKVVIRFQIFRNVPDPAPEPTVEVSAGKHMKPLTDAALKAIRDTLKKVKFPAPFKGSRIEFRAMFLYNLAAGSTPQ